MAAPVGSVLESARTVLKQESADDLAAGAFPGSAAAGGAAPGDAWQHLQAQAHELVDALLEALGQGPTPVDGIERTAENAPALLPGARDGAAPGVLVARAPVAPGETAEVVMALESDEPADESRITLRTTDLVGRGGGRIPATRVTVEPPTAIVPPGGSVDARIEIAVPAEARAGTYCGLVQASELADLRAVFEVKVDG